MMTASDWTMSTLQRVIRDLDSFEDGRIIANDVLDGYNVSLELVYREFLAKEVMGETNDNLKEACELLGGVLRILETMKDESVSCSNEVRHPVIHTGELGRPRYDISKDQLQYLLENKFTVPQIAEMIAVSQRTVFRRMNEFSLSVTAHYSSISDEDLDMLVGEIQHGFPMCGNTQMQGHLFARGHRVQQIRVRESQRRVDRVGCTMRRLKTINRREYKVPGPLALWHIDGNHKLIRYT